MLCSPTLQPRAFQSLLGFQTSPNCPASKVPGVVEPFPVRMKPCEGRRNSSSWIRYGALQSVAETMQENGNFIDLHSYIGAHSSDSSKEDEKEDKEEKEEEEEEEEEERLVSKRLELSFESVKNYENNQILLSESTTPWRSDGSANLFSQEDESIVESEKLRRMRISETNRGQIPWNKGVRYTQEGRQSGTSNRIVGDMDDDAYLLKKEKQRRQKISSANKGKTPWNKGRQHSEETRRRIRERTMEAMKNPKIREKLRVHGATLSSETRSKISNSLSLVWDARKKTKQAQETLIEQWRECIADTARRGDGSNEAYEWNSYNLILKELQHIWNLNRKKRKKKESSVGLSVDHRIKISNAIKSKWANIEYRNTVRAGIHAHWAKQSSEATQRRRNIRRKETSQNKEIDVVVKNNAVSKPSIRSELPVQSKKPPTYKNPSSAEMMMKLKHIREARALEDAKRKEVTDRARVLMAEAQRATRALEAAAAFDKNALVPLREAQRLLAEAAWSFKSAGLDTGLSFDTPNGE